MELSEKERKMLAWLTKQDAAWPLMRWIILISAILCITVYMSGYLDDLAVLLVGVGGLSYTLGSWSGRAEVSLLLRLVNEHVVDKHESIE